MICKTSHPVLQRMEMQTDAVVPSPGCVCIKSCRVETSRGGEDPVTQFEPRRKAIGLQIDIRLWSSADQCSLAAERGIECYLLLQIVLKNQFLIMCNVEKECKSEDFNCKISQVHIYLAPGPAFAIVWPTPTTPLKPIIQLSRSQSHHKIIFPKLNRN